MEERRRLEFWVWDCDECYKVEVRFEDIVETVGCCINGASEINGFLLRVKVFTFFSSNFLPITCLLQCAC